MSHNLIVSSPLAEASVLLSGLYVKEYTALLCPWSVSCSLPVLTSQSFMVLSTLPEASVLPSGLNATQITKDVCPRRVPRSLGCWADSGASATSPRLATVRQARERNAIGVCFIGSPCRRDRAGVPLLTVPHGAAARKRLDKFGKEPGRTSGKQDHVVSRLALIVDNPDAPCSNEPVRPSVTAAVLALRVALHWP